MNNPKIKYTILKNDIFYLNFRIPLSLRIIRLSLQTDSRRQAQLIVSMVTPLIIKIQKVGQSMSYIDDNPLISSQIAINTLVKILTIKVKEFANALMHPTSNMTAFTKEDYNFLLDDIDRGKIAEDTGADIEDVDASINERYNQEHLNCIEFLSCPEHSMLTIKAEQFLADFINKNNPFYNNALRAIEYVFHQANKINSDIKNYEYEQAETALKLLQNYSDKLNGIEPEPEPEKITSHQIVIAPETKKPTSPLLSDCIKNFIHDKTEGWTDKILKARKRELEILQLILGDCPISEVDGELLDKAFKVVKNLPKSNGKPYNRMTTEQIVEVAKQNTVEDSKKIGNKSFIEYRKTLQGLFAFLRKERVIKGASPTEDMFTEFEKKERRGAFTVTQVRSVLGFSSAQKEPWKRYGVMIMAYGGMRNGEVVQLRKQDIKTCPETKVNYIHVTNQSGSVKTDASVRRVPIHSKLVEAGFLYYVSGLEEGSKLFNCTDKSLTRFYQVMKKALKLPNTDELENKLSLYSLRHRVVTTLRSNNVNDSIVQQLVGHRVSKGSITDDYTHEIELGQLQKAVEVLNY